MNTQTRTVLSRLACVCALFGAMPAVGALKSLDDGELSSVDGGDGISLALNDIQVVTGDKTTLSVGLDSKTLALYADNLRIYKQGASNPEVISASNGFDLGSASDPILIDIETLAKDSSTPWLSDNLNFLNIQLPKSGVTYSISDTNRSGNNLVAGGVADTTGTTDATGKSLQRYARVPNSKMEWRSIPFSCNNTSQDCLSVALRLRFDIFKAIDDPSSDYVPDQLRSTLVDRQLLWVKADGVNLNGTKLRVWGDDTDGIAFTADITAYINELHATSSYTGTPAGITSGDLATGYSLVAGANGTQQIFKNGVDTGETVETLQKTAPYSDAYTPTYSDTDGNVGLKLSGVYVDAHLGRIGYQPVSVQTIVTPKSRAEPNAGCAGSVTGSDGQSYCPDDVTNNIRLLIREIPNTQAIYEDFYSAPKTNIHVEQAQIDDYNLGSLSIQGLQIQSLKFTTQDLTPLEAKHCPTGWTCSF